MRYLPVVLAVLALAAPRGVRAQQATGTRYVVSLRAQADTARLRRDAVRWQCAVPLMAPRVAAMVCPWRVVDSLRRHRDVRGIDVDVPDDLPPPEPTPAMARADDPTATVPWHLRLIAVDSLWNRGLTGAGVTVGIIDSGIDPTHPDFEGRVRGYSVIGTDTLAWREETGCRDHGTHVTGSALSRSWGVAPDATGITVRVFEQINGACRSWQSSQIAGIGVLRQRGAGIISASIGGTSQDQFSYAPALAAYHAAGGVFAGAAGNAGISPPQFPGGYATAVTVGSTPASGTGRSSFSNWGATLDVMAAGEGIVSTMPGGATGTKSGTSMATPQVAGVLALIRQRLPTVSSDSVVAILRAGVRDLGPVGWDDQTGYGLVDGMALVRLLFAPAPMIATPAATAVGATRCVPVAHPVPWSAAADDSSLALWQTPGGDLCWLGTVPGQFTIRLRSI